MATFLDLTVLRYFSIIFTFILAFVIVYGFLEVFKMFGSDRKGLHAWVALAMAFLVVLTSSVVNVIKFALPWIFIVILAIFFIIFAIRMFGVEESAIAGYVKGSGVVATWIIVIVIVILVFAFGSAFGQQTLEKGQGNGGTVNVTGNQTAGGTSFNQNVYNTLFNPKVLGLIFFMVVGIFTIVFLTAAAD